MANICLYKIRVSGRKQACYAFVDMMPLYSYDKIFLREEGTDDNFTLVFSGDCKWSVDSYTNPKMDVKPFAQEELDAVNDGDHWDMPINKKAIALGVEVWCNSKDIDSSTWSVYEHYDKDGNRIKDECPKELHIKRGRDYDD